MAPHRGASEPLRRAISIPNASAFVCRSCRFQLNQSSRSHAQQLRHASQQEIPFTEKIRRRIWGTDKPPGLADPYGGPSFLERSRIRKQGRQSAVDNKIEGERTETDSELALGDSRDEIPEPAIREPVVVEEYKPAETWDGLQHVGHKGDWRDLPPQKEDDFRPWIDITQQPATTRAELLSCLHQAIIESLPARNVDLSATADRETEPQPGQHKAPIASRIILSQDGRISHLEDVEAVQGIAFDDGHHVKDTLTGIPENESLQESLESTHSNSTSTGQESSMDEEKYSKAAAQVGPIAEVNGQIQLEGSPESALDEEFLSAKLDFTDPITFSILKRFSQLSRQRIPDPILNAMQEQGANRDLSYLITQLTRPVRTKPKPLSETLMKKSKLASQSNVMILSRRETPVDREKEVGRWKVIERELKNRGLPILGRAVA